MADDAAIEAMAQAAASSTDVDACPNGEWRSPSLRALWRVRMAAALAAYRDHQRAAGIVEVPREPTAKIIVHGIDVFDGTLRGMGEAYRAMIAAAQEKSDG